MKFKDLSLRQIERIKAVHKAEKADTRNEILSREFNVQHRTIERWVKRLEIANNCAAAEPEYIQVAKGRKTEKSKYYIVTSAQNATPIFRPLWDNIQAYAKHLNASIHVVPYRYKNPTSRFFDLENDYWDNEFHPFLDLNRHHISPTLMLLSDIKTQPTAEDPLSGFEALSGVASCIIGHPKRQLKSVPVAISHPQKLIATSLAVTVHNYTDSKAGKKAEFWHRLGFTIVETSDDCENWTFRQVECDQKGGFIDLDTSVSGGQISTVSECEAYIMGDVHIRKTNPESLRKSIENIKKLKPKRVVLHDVADGDSINHHEKKNYVLLAKKAEKGLLSIANEIEEVLGFVGTIADLVGEENVYIVKSNHDEFFDRYLNETDWRKDISRAKDYIMLLNAAMNSENGVIPYLINDRFEGVHCLSYSDSSNVKGWELSLHGHKGANGSRGSIRQFRGASFKLITAHSHSVGFMGNCCQVGINTHRWQDYTKGGLNAAACADAVILENGTVQHLIG